MTAYQIRAIAVHVLMATILSPVLAIPATLDSCAKRRLTSVNRVLASTTATVKILSEATGVVAYLEHLEQIVKLTSTSVTVILVKTGLRASMELTSILVSACPDSPEFTAKQTSTSVLHLLAPTMESASI